MPDDIQTLEHQADRHRAQAGSALSALFGAIAPSRIGHTAVERASNVTESVAQSALRQAQQNPAGLALIGVGLALVALGKTKPDPTTAYGTESERIARADARIEQRTRIQSGTTPQDASSMRKVLDKGLDKLPPAARERVMQARLKAVDAQESVERQARKMRATMSAAHQDNPLVTAVAVAGVGALVGALLPSTRIEQDMLAAKRDQLLRNAESLLREEVAELERRGQAAVSAAAEAASEPSDRAKRA